MKRNWGWKQPTPTDIRSNESIDTLSRMLFLEILNGTQNKEYHKVYYHGNKRIDLTLKRGQYLFNVAKYQRDLGIPRKRITNSLATISKWYIELQLEAHPFGTVITIKNYDEVVKTKIERQNEVKSKLNRSEIEVNTKNNIDNIDNIENNENIENISKDIGAKAPTVYDGSIEEFNIDGFLEDYELIRKHYLPNSRGIKVIDSKTRRQLAGLVKQGITREDMQQALKTMFADKYHKETNWRYCTPEFITRHDKFTRFSMLETNQLENQSKLNIDII